MGGLNVGSILIGFAITVPRLPCLAAEDILFFNVTKSSISSSSQSASSSDESESERYKVFECDLVLGSLRVKEMTGCWDVAREVIVGEVQRCGPVLGWGLWGLGWCEVWWVCAEDISLLAVITI